MKLSNDLCQELIRAASREPSFLELAVAHRAAFLGEWPWLFHTPLSDIQLAMAYNLSDHTVTRARLFDPWPSESET